MTGTPARAYREHHGFLTFSLDLRLIGAEFWLHLGEARSKVDHLAFALLSPAVATELHFMYLAKGVHATTAIEGNTLTEEAAIEIIEGRHVAPPSQQYLVREVENVVAACNAMADEVLGGADPTITVDLIKRFNRQILEGTELKDDGVVPGELRNDSRVVGRYRAVPWEDCEYLLERLCEWLRGPDFTAESEEWRVPYALLKAMVAHLYLAWIHPFGDGNGRTARLVELQILFAAGFPMPACHLLSNHYNETRDEYYRQLDRASTSGGDILPFLRYAAQGFIDGLRTQLSRVWEQQYADRWEQFIYETFGHTHTAARERQRRLVLELSKRADPVPRRDLPRMTVELFAAYQGTERTLSRDLNALEKLGLIERVRSGWRPRRDQILAFRSPRREILTGNPD